MIVDQPTSQRLAATTRFADILERPEIDSTNRYLLDRARRGAPEGTVVVADHQSAGRGRRDRSWEARPGAALLMSVLLRPEVAPDRRWLVTAAVALAAADACQAEIKWPNDLLLGGAKLAGILAEADAGAIVVGIGINVAWAPPGAACLGSSVDRGQLMATLLTNLEHWCDRWDDAGVAYRRRCATVGRPVRVELPGRAVQGSAVGVDADGHLLVAPDAGPGGDCDVLTLSVADVIHVTAP